MHDESDWGPWYRHCGTKMPQFDGEMQVEIPTGARYVVFCDEEVIRCVVTGKPYDGPRFGSSWIWDKPGIYIPVLHYRYRRSRALRDLIAIAANPRPPQETADADAA